MSRKLRTFHIGFDDTDSAEGMCTTFLCYTAVKLLLKEKRTTVNFLDYPNLIRLNPNIPWKTRGNAALVLRIRTNATADDLLEFFKSLVLRFATSPKANSGLIILEGEKVPAEILEFSRKALRSVLGLREAHELILKFGLHSFAQRSRQGLIGALAGIGNLLSCDHTFELLGYRKDLNHPRKLPLRRVLELNSFPGTFSSYDSLHDRIMIAPHGPDPVLCGIRGETASEVKRAFESLLPIENLGGYMIVRSNQGTGEHLTEEISLSTAPTFSSGKIVGEVISLPRPQIGGHVFFSLRNFAGQITCASYEPTAEFRKDVLQLIPGDLVEVGGGVRKATSLHSKVFNLEYLRPLKLEIKMKKSNPNCPKCQSRLSSQGKEQRYRCDKCGYVPEKATKVKELLVRKLETRLYLPPIKAHRHLTKPLQRYSKEKTRAGEPIKLIDGWIS